jgi:hypothetical protein
VPDEQWLTLEDVARLAAGAGLEKEALRAVAAGEIPSEHRRIGSPRVVFLDLDYKVRREDLKGWLCERTSPKR